RQSLTFFLLDPEKVRPAGRMPNMKLLVVEAADIAAYLLTQQPADARAAQDALAPPHSRQLIGRGQQLFVSLGCANCHQAPGVKPSLAAKPISQLAKSNATGCLSADDPGTPRFGL